MAAGAVTAFNAWQHVSDDDRLEAVLTDHCLPYVRTGATPFAGMGRPVGVYDQAPLSDGLTNGGNAVIFDNRFVAQWGEGEDANSPARVCTVNATFPRPDSRGFEVALVGAQDRITTSLPPDLNLTPDPSDLGPPPLTVSWREASADAGAGLRIFMTGQIIGVSTIIVIDDLAP